MSEDRRGGLRRSLGLLETTVGGVGIILGAGIYALVGEVAGRAGNAMWLSFLMAAGMSGLIGLCYAEMASALPSAGADFAYTRRALGPRAGFVVGWLIVISNLVGAATVALGFGAYLERVVGLGATQLGLGLLVVATVVAFYGIREAVWLSAVLTAVEASGLVFIIAVGVPHLGNADLLEFEAGAQGVFSGAALVMFAFIGFTQIATLSEETRDAGSVVPKAMLLAIGATTALYVLVALSAISVAGWGPLSAAAAPLALVAEDALGGSASDFITAVALFSTSNTVLLMLVAASRLIYGMAREEALPRFLAWVHPGVRTPARAIVLSLAVAGGFTLSGDIDLVASATNFAVFIGFGAVCLSLIVLRYREPALPRPFRLRLNLGRFPLLPPVAIVSVAFMMANLERDALLLGSGLLVAGLVAMEALALWRPARE